MDVAVKGDGTTVGATDRCDSYVLGCVLDDCRHHDEGLPSGALEKRHISVRDWSQPQGPADLRELHDPDRPLPLWSTGVRTTVVDQEVGANEQGIRTSNLASATGRDRYAACRCVELGLVHPRQDLLCLSGYDLARTAPHQVVY